MIHRSSYHSNGLPTVVWNNKVHLIGEKVYKPKIHFCEYCDKPILVYGRLIPCKHVFCLTCATSCLTHCSPPLLNQIISSPKITKDHASQSPNPNKDTHYNLDVTSKNNNHNNNNTNSNFNIHNPSKSTPIESNQRLKDSGDLKNFEFNKSDSNHSSSIKDGSNRDESSMIIDDSTSNTTPNTVQVENINNSPRTTNNGATPPTVDHNPPNSIKGCHRCGNRALRVERNTLNSIFVCDIETCKRTYLSAKDLQAHVNHRHNRNKSSNNHTNNHGPNSASIQAISSSPYISSSSLLHMNKNNSNQKNNHQSSISNNYNRSSRNNNTNRHVNNHSHQGRVEPSDNSSPNNQNQINRRDSDNNRSQVHQPDLSGARKDRDRSNDRRNESRERFREREREVIQRERDRERNSKEYHRQSMQRAAQWAEASAQMLEKGLSK